MGAAVTAPRPGMVFTHARLLDLDAPVRDRVPAQCRITAVRAGWVYYTYASSPINKGHFKVDVREWMDTYG